MNDNLKKTMDAAKQLLEACKKDPTLADELVKALRPEERGVHKPFEIQSNFPRKRGGFQDVKGLSGMGHDVRNARSLRSTYLQNPAQRPALIAQSQASARASAKHHLAEQRAMPKPNLPKSEPMDKTQGVPKGVDKDKMERCVQDVKGQGGVKNKYAICAASLQGKTHHKAEHQPHPGASKPEHQKEYDKKQQAEHEKRLKSPEGEAERQKRNSKMRDMFKADDEKFLKLRKDPPSEGTGLPKPDSPHETPADRKEKRVSLTKEELKECMKADDKTLQARPQGEVRAGGAGGGSRRINSWRHAGGTAPRGPHGGASDTMRTVDMRTGQYKMHGPKGNLPKAEKNPDEKADAALGEKVEHDVEQHFKENAAAERKEGHKIS